MKANYKKLLSFGAIALATIVTSMSARVYATDTNADTGKEDHVYDKVKSVEWEAENGVPTGKVKITFECTKHTEKEDGVKFTKVEEMTGEEKTEEIDTACCKSYTRYMVKVKAGDKETEHYSDPFKWDLKENPKHQWKAFSETKKATCVNEGTVETGQICELCGTKDTTITTTPKGEHDFVVTSRVADSSKSVVDTTDNTTHHARNVVENKGVFSLDDYDEDGVYLVVSTCNICGKVKVEEVKIPASEQTQGRTVYEHVSTKTSKVGTDSRGREYNTEDNTWIYYDSENDKWSAGLYDCSKDGVYAVVTYGRGHWEDTYDENDDLVRVYVNGAQLNYRKETIKADSEKAHTPDAIKLGKVSSNNITAIKAGTENEEAKEGDYIKIVNGKPVVTNGSCKEAGWYEEVVCCSNPECNKKDREISRKKVTLDPSNIHPVARMSAKEYIEKADEYAKLTEKEKAAKAEEIEKFEDNFIFENITGECEKGLYRDVYTKCKVCGKKMDFVRTEKFQVGHIPGKAVMDPDTYVAPTQHNPGYYESVVYCTVCGKELSRTEVTVEPDPETANIYTWTFSIQWPQYKYFVGNEANNRFKNNTKVYALLVASPTDSDLSVNQKEDRTMTLELEAIEDESKAVKGNTCKVGERTFDVTVTKKNARAMVKMLRDYTDPENLVTVEELMKMSDTQAFNWDDGYKGGHKWGKPVTEKKDGKTITKRVCTLCGEEMIDGEVVDPIPDPEPISIKKAVIEGTAQFRGEYFNVPFTVTLDGKQLTENKDFVLTNARKNNFRAVGSHTIKIAGIGNYTGTAKGTLTITKADQNIKMSKTKKTFKASTLKKKAASFITTITNAHGKLSYKTSSKKITFKKQAVGTYKVTAKKGTKAGTYTITINFATSKNYNAAQKKITITVK